MHCDIYNKLLILFMTAATYGGTGGRAFENVCAVNADHNDSCFPKCDQYEWIPIVVTQLHSLV